METIRELERILQEKETQRILKERRTALLKTIGKLRNLVIVVCILCHGAIVLDIIAYYRTGSLLTALFVIGMGYAAVSNLKLYKQHRDNYREVERGEWDATILASNVFS
jgi:hypothetical protein